MALFGSSKREGPYRNVFVEPGELREGVVDLIGHCWSIWEGKEDPVTPLEHAIRLASGKCYLHYYSWPYLEARSCRLDRSLLEYLGWRPFYVIRADANLIRLVYPFVSDWESFISVLREVVGVTYLE